MGSEQKEQSNNNKIAIFLKRLISTVLLWTIVLAALFAPWRALSLSTFFIIITLLTTIGMLEFYSCIEKKKLPAYKSFGMLLGIIYTITVFSIHAFFKHISHENEILIFLIFSLLAITIFARRLAAPVNSDGFIALGTTFLGLLYIPFLFSFVQLIYFVFGSYVLLFFMLLTKFSDSGAYIFGSLLGKHKMAPTISPGKTWEGFAGAILMPIAVGFLTKFLSGKNLSFVTNTEVVAIGIILGIGAVVGDLIESVFKRECGIKDSGNYFPGVGGILDVLDSILFNAPIMYFYLYCKFNF
ncbi:MAG: phosphatidate cytidylyltransferase [Verrucomicrobiae bacterium]|nr:phosphatidate cytidylyltransferase [Verrucomicrobiae bacterium]